VLGYLLIAFSILTSVAALRGWVRWLEPRAKRIKEPVELGNRDIPYGGVIIGHDRPDPFRTGCNVLAVGLCMMIPATLHVFAIRGVWRAPQVGPSYLIFYGVTLLIWLAFIGLAASAFCMHREARARRLSGRSSVD
jgi:hypothetical protein